MPDIWPAPLDDVVTFISYLFHRGYAPSSATSYVAAISFWHKINNMPDHTANFLVTKALEGYRRMRPTFDSRIPITYETLCSIIHILPAVCFSKYEASLFSAAFSLAFFGLFRVSEIVVSSGQHVARASHMDDISITPTNKCQTITVRLRVSKTSQSGASVSVPICQVSGEVCAVDLMARYLKLRCSLSDYLFCHVNGQPLTRYQFGAILSKCVEYLQLPSRSYRTHSFRIGAATWLSSRGVSDDVIKKMGRWKSDAFKKYIRL